MGEEADFPPGVFPPKLREPQIRHPQRKEQVSERF